MESKLVDSKVYPLKELFSDKFDVDFYQREYVWQRKQIEDLIMDLSTEFIKTGLLETHYLKSKNMTPTIWEKLFFLLNQEKEALSLMVNSE